MSAMMQTETETEVEYTPEYGDKFQNYQTGDTVTVHDVRDGMVTFVNGQTETVEDLREAVEEVHFAWKPVAVGDDKFEGDGYGDY